LTMRSLRSPGLSYTCTVSLRTERSLTTDRAFMRLLNISPRRSSSDNWKWRPSSTVTRDWPDQGRFGDTISERRHVFRKKERIEKLSHLLVRGYSSRSQLFMVRFLFSPYEDHRSRYTNHSHGSQSGSDPGDAEYLHPWHHALDVQYVNGEARHVD
jgi:hypothetical protein